MFLQEKPAMVAHGSFSAFVSHIVAAPTLSYQYSGRIEAATFH